MPGLTRRWLETGTPATRVTNLELFFDLVFVFTLTRISAMLADGLDALALVRSLLVFGVLWWMYGGYAWLTNQVEMRGVAQRVLLLAGMAGFMLTAIAIPDAFDESGLLFGLGYLLVVVVHLVGLGQSQALGAVARLAVFNLASAALVLGAAFVDERWRPELFGAAILLQLLTPFLGVAPRFDLNPAHFVERHGLLVIIALGESVIAIGASVDASHLDALGIGTMLLALALPAALWWAHFGADHAELAERNLASCDPARRGVIAIRAFFFAFAPLLFGIVAAAAGLHHVVAHPDAPVGWASMSLLAIGAAAFFVGEWWSRRELGLPRDWLLVGAALCALTTLGAMLPGWAALAITTATVVATTAAAMPAGDTTVEANSRSSDADSEA